MVEELKGKSLFHASWRKEHGKDGPELKRWFKEAKEATGYDQVRRLIFELEASSPAVHKLCMEYGLEEQSEAALRKTLLPPKERRSATGASKTIMSAVRSFVADTRAPAGGHAPSVPIAEEPQSTPQRSLSAVEAAPKHSPAQDPAEAAAARKRKLDRLAEQQRQQQRAAKQQRLQKQLERSSDSQPEEPAAEAVAVASASTSAAAVPERKRLVKSASVVTEADGGSKPGATSAAVGPPAEHPEYDEPWNSSTNAKAQIGRRLQLYWGGDRKWFKGRVERFNTATWAAYIHYDDGDVKVRAHCCAMALCYPLLRGIVGLSVTAR